MISIIAGIVAVMLWMFICAFAVVRFEEGGITDALAWVLVAIAVWGLAFAINEFAEYERQNPCVAYESRMTYNAATKTMMPMRVCVERGEWE